MCPNCRAFITAADRTCPYCGNQVGPRAIDLRSPANFLGGLIPPSYFTAVLILLINLALFVATCWLSGSFMGDVNARALWALGAKLGYSVFVQHEYWRLVTAGFLHGSLLHIAFNSWALYVLCPQVEEFYGTSRLIVVYFVATVCGFYLSARMNPGISIGASAGIMGLIGAMVAFGAVNQSSLGRAIRNNYLGLLGINLALGFMRGSNVDNWAHIGGFAGGFAVAYIAGTPIRSSQTKEAIWRLAAAASLMLTAYCFWLMYRNFPTPEELRELLQSGGVG